MESKNLQFLQKLETLPEEVSVFVYSKELASFVEEISKKFGLNHDLVSDLLLDFFVVNFDIKEMEKIISSQLDNKNILNDFFCDFLGKIFLPVAPFIGAELENEIKVRGGNLDDYQINIDIFDGIMDDQNLNSLNELAEDLNKNIDINEEERLSTHFLEKDLVQVLKSENPLSARKINGSILYLLSKKTELSAKFSRSLLSNQEVLTKNLLIINNKKEDPTIANWIKSFIKENGSSNFSNIVLAKFLTSSVNCLNLDEVERRLVRKILRLYRNLSFFPDSMANIPFNEWEIIPLDKDNLISDSLSKRETKIVTEKKDESGEIKIGLEKKDLSEKEKFFSEKEQKIKELELMLEKYPNKSLERKAIESEINKLKK